MMCSLLPALLIPSNVKMLAPKPNFKLTPCGGTNGFRTPSGILSCPLQFKPVKTLQVRRRHSHRLNYHYQFSFSPYEPSLYKPSLENKEPNIIEGVSPDGVKAHISLMEKIDKRLLVPISYKAKKRQVVFDKHRSSIIQWYSDRLLAFRGEDKDWLKYIAGAAWCVMVSIFECLRYSVSSGISFSSNGHFLNHMMICDREEGLLFLPFELNSSVDWKTDLQIVSNFLYVVYNKRPLQEMKNLDSVTADHWLETTPSFLKKLYHFLPTFDPNKHCAEVMLNPPYFWIYVHVVEFVTRLYRFIFGSSSGYYYTTFDLLLTQMGFNWLDKLPEKGTLIRDLFDEFGGFDTYKNNIDILKFYANMVVWDNKRIQNPYSDRPLSREGVVIKLDAQFGLVWVLYRLCVEYFVAHENMTGCKRDSKECLLHHLGFTDDHIRV